MFDALLIRGAPGVGKTSSANLLLAKLGRGALVEVDALRTAQVGCDWQNRMQHSIALKVAACCVAPYVAGGVRPVVIVDTFGRTSVQEMQEHMSKSGLSHITISLWANLRILSERIRQRSGKSTNLSLSQLINNEIAELRFEKEHLLDTSVLTLEDTVEKIERILIREATILCH